MKQTIKRICKEIEKEKKVKILFCIEAGSRVWRLESKDSDYDVRFVFVRPLTDYVSINKADDVITAHFDKKGNKMSAEGCYLDFCGFDVFKFSKMLSASNPNVIEWLKSDIDYYGKKRKVWVDYAENQFKRISLYYHYKSMCRQNYLKYLKSGNLVTYKKYLYAMRGLVNSKYITWDIGLPSIDFDETLKTILRLQLTGNFKEILPASIIEKLWKVIELKKRGKEKNIIQNIVKIDNYIESFLKDDSDAPINKRLSTTLDLDKELKKIVLGGKK